MNRHPNSDLRAIMAAIIFTHPEKLSHIEAVSEADHLIDELQRTAKAEPAGPSDMLVPREWVDKLTARAEKAEKALKNADAGWTAASQTVLKLEAEVDQLRPNAKAWVMATAPGGMVEAMQRNVEALTAEIDRQKKARARVLRLTTAKIRRQREELRRMNERGGKAREEWLEAELAKEREAFNRAIAVLTKRNDELWSANMDMAGKAQELEELQAAYEDVCNQLKEAQEANDATR